MRGEAGGELLGPRPAASRSPPHRVGFYSPGPREAAAEGGAGGRVSWGEGRADWAGPEGGFRLLPVSGPTLRRGQFLLRND